MADTATTLEHLTVPAVEDATTTPRTQRKKLNKDEQLVANVRDMVATLRAHPGYASESDLAGLERAAHELETATASHAAVKASSAERKRQTNAETAAARAAITREGKAKIERIESEVRGSYETKETLYGQLSKVFVRVNLTAKQHLLTDDNPANDTVAKILKKI